MYIYIYNSQSPVWGRHYATVPFPNKKNVPFPLYF